MEIRAGLKRVGLFDLEEARDQAERTGYAVFVIPHVIDRASFFDAVRAVFPLDPPLLGSHSWDALSDSLWEGLSTHAAQRVAILWPNTKSMAISSPADFDMALSVLTDLVNSLADPALTTGKPKEIAVLVEY